MRLKSFIAFVGLAGCVFAQSEERAAQQIELPKASNQTAKSNEEITVKSPITVNLQTTPKTKEESEQIADDRQEKISFDSSYLRTQEWLVGIGVVTAIFYGFQCALLICTLRNATESSERQMRAYVGMDTSVQKKDDIPTQVPPNHFGFTIINAGQTPAYDFEVVYGWKEFPGVNTPWPLSEKYETEAPVVRSKGTIMPHRPTPVYFEFLFTANGRVPWATVIDKANKNESTLYLYGTMHYRDTFTKKRFTNFCLRYNPLHPRRFGVCDHHYESD